MYKQMYENTVIHHLIITHHTLSTTTIAITLLHHTSPSLLLSPSLFHPNYNYYHRPTNISLSPQYHITRLHHYNTNPRPTIISHITLATINSSPHHTIHKCITVLHHRIIQYMYESIIYITTLSYIIYVWKYNLHHRIIQYTIYRYDSIIYITVSYNICMKV